MNNKLYLYKHYQTGIFQGILNVVSEYAISQEINTAGAQVEIELPIAFQDAGVSFSTDLLIDEGDNLIVTQDNEAIILNTTIASGAIPSLGDRIDIYEYSDEDTVGERVFTGLVSKWNSNYSDNSTKLSLLSYGVYLDNYMVQILPQQTLVEALTSDSSAIIYGPGKEGQTFEGLPFSYDRDIGVAQTFSIAGTSDITSIYLKVGNSGSFAVQIKAEIYQGTPTTPGGLIGSLTRSIPAGTGMTEYLLQFSTSITLTGGVTYFILITNPLGSNISETNTLGIAYNSTSSYAGGAKYILNETTGYSSPAGDIYFRIISSSGGVGNQFLSQDPSDIFRSLIDNFNSLGGIPTYNASSVEQSGTVVSYEFKFNTYLEAVKKVVELAPPDWWWSVDPGTNIVSLKGLSDEADHTFVLGTHIEDLDITYSLEQVINTVYLSGGDTGGGVNLLVISTDDESVSSYGPWLDKPVDTRVSDETTGEILADNEVAQFKDPRFGTTLTILASVYDIASIKIGQVVGFANTNSLIDSLKLQVMALRYTPSQVVLTLAILPPTQSKRIEDIKRNLEQEQTVNNPQ